MLRRLVLLLAIGCVTMGTTRTLRGQTTPPPVTAPPVVAPPHPDSVAVMLPFARAHVALNALRERADAEYAEPKNKKPEVLADLRAKNHLERERLLKTQGITEASYAEVIRRISGDDAARLAFEAALVRATAK